MQTVINPWANLDLSSSSIVAPCDQDAIQQLVNKNPNTFHLDLYPEPFIGSPDANVYFLSLNPGCDEQNDPNFIRNKTYEDYIQKNLKHQPLNGFDFYYFNEIKLSDGTRHSGCEWWTKECRHILKELEGRLPNFFNIEYFPYHTVNGTPIPNKSNLLPSFEYSNQLIRKAIADGKLIVILRREKGWYDRVPGLKNYKNLLVHPNPRNIMITQNTFGKQIWQQLCSQLESTKSKN